MPVEIKEIDRQYAPDMYRLTDRYRSQLRTWLPWVDTTQCVEDTLSFINSVTSSPHMKQFVILFDGQLVGVCGFYNIDKYNQIGQIGYWLANSYQGKGIATKALTQLCDKGFSELGLNKLELHIATENTPSRALAERCAFKLEGVLKQREKLRDQFLDHAIYAKFFKDTSA